MKVVLATPLYPPEPGGPATYAQLLVEHWHRNRGAETEEEKGRAGMEPDEIILVKFSDVRHLPKGIRHIVYFFKVLKVARHADVILALDPVSVGLPALWAARFSSKSLVVKIVGDFAWEQGRQRFGITTTLDEFILQKNVPLQVSFLRKIEASVARHAAAIIVPSNYLKGIVSSWENVPAKKIQVIYNSMVLPELPQLPVQSADSVAPTASLQRNGKKRGGEHSHIVSVGRLVPWKGMSELLDALVEVQKEIPEASLTIVGDGPERVTLEAKVSELVTAEKLTPETVQFTGALPHAEALAIVRDATVYVQNSSYEGLSHQLIEALMLGKPIIATNVGGNPELIEHEKNGILIAWADTASLVSEITRVLKDEALRQRLEEKAAESSTRFSVPAMIEKTRALLMETISLPTSRV